MGYRANIRQGRHLFGAAGASQRVTRCPTTGFTLIEMMVVVVVIAALAATVVPALSTTTEDAAAAARTLSSDLQWAQANAIATATPTFVRFTTAGYTIYPAWPLASPATHPATLKPYVVSQPLTWTLQSIGDDVLGFDDMGRPTSCPATGTPTLMTTAAVVRIGPESVAIDPSTGQLTIAP